MVFWEFDRHLFYNLPLEETPVWFQFFLLYLNSKHISQQRSMRFLLVTFIGKTPNERAFKIILVYRNFVIITV